MAVGPTKNVTLTGVYQRLCSIYGTMTNKIMIGDTAANKVVLTALTKAVDIAWGEIMPNVKGHQIAIAGTMTLSGLGEIGYAWVKNTVIADTAELVITPIQEFDRI